MSEEFFHKNNKFITNTNKMDIEVSNNNNLGGGGGCGGGCGGGGGCGAPPKTKGKKPLTKILM